CLDDSEVDRATLAPDLFERHEALGGCGCGNRNLDLDPLEVGDRAVHAEQAASVGATASKDAQVVNGNSQLGGQRVMDEGDGAPGERAEQILGRSRGRASTTEGRRKVRVPGKGASTELGPPVHQPPANGRCGSGSVWAGSIQLFRRMDDLRLHCRTSLDRASERYPRRYGRQPLPPSGLLPKSRASRDPSTVALHV